MAWDATGGCWKQSLPCSNLYAAVGGTCEVGMEGTRQGQVAVHTQCWVHLTCVEYMCVVPGTHLVLSVLAALGVCIVVLGAHLVLSVLAILSICVGYMCVDCTWCCLCVGYMYSGVGCECVIMGHVCIDP